MFFPCITAEDSVKINWGDDMKNSKDLLSSILKTTQMGQVGIRAVMKANVSSDLRVCLEDQLAEYDKIEQQAHTLAREKKWTLEELDPAVRKMAELMTRAQLSMGNVRSKTAAMMIQGNTRGMIKSLKNLHHYNHSDNQIEALGNKLLSCEESNIKQMQRFV